MSMMVGAIPHRGKFVGIILYPESKAPVYWFRTNTNPDLIVAELVNGYVAASAVGADRMQAELDFVKLFGTRAPEGHLEGIVKPTEDELFEHFEKLVLGDTGKVPV